MTDRPEKISILAKAAAHDLWPLALATFAIWVALPSILFSNLHTDTLEAAYWGRDLAFGYEKHPPLLSWLIRLVLVPGPFSIASLLLLSHGLALITTLFIYMTIADRASQGAAQLGGVLGFLASTATFYALQLNHNSALTPFMAASLFFGWRFISYERAKDVMAFGTIFALGILTKYQIILVLPALVGLALYEKKIFTLLRRPATFSALVLALIIIAPHIIWLKDNHWASLGRAAGSAAIKNPADIFFSLWGGIIGLVAAIGLPAITTFVLFRTVPRIAPTSQREHTALRPAQLMLYAPLAGIVILTLGTLQYIKALWILPITPSLIIGLALWCNATYDLSPLTLDIKRRAGFLATSAMAVLYSLYLVLGLIFETPLESYLADTKTLSEKAEKIWYRHSSTPLTCVITDELKLGPAAILWMETSPMILPLNANKWSTEQRVAPCRQSGGIALMIDPDKNNRVTDQFPNACVGNIITHGIGTPFTGRALFWQADIIVIPPAASDCAHMFGNQPSID